MDRPRRVGPFALLLPHVEAGASFVEPETVGKDDKRYWPTDGSRRLLPRGKGARESSLQDPVGGGVISP